MDATERDAQLDTPQLSGENQLKITSAHSFQSSELVIDVLAYLDSCSPRAIKETSAESKAKSISGWCLGVSIFALLVVLVVMLTVDKSDASHAIRLFVLVMICLSTLAALFSLIVPIIVVGLLAFRWKSLAFDGLCGDLRHEQKLAEGLYAFGESTLKDAQFWLERRVGRISSRTTFFFGGRTAVVGLLAAGYSFAADLGGYQWISHTLAKGLTLDNWHNTLLLWGGALLLGLSIGAILLEKVTDRYRYQIELLELARRESKGA